MSVSSSCRHMKYLASGGGPMTGFLHAAAVQQVPAPLAARKSLSDNVKGIYNRLSDRSSPTSALEVGQVTDPVEELRWGRRAGLAAGGGTAPPQPPGGGGTHPVNPVRGEHRIERALIPVQGAEE